nr:hypothetical protein [Allobaculum sp. Allo2]
MFQHPDKWFRHPESARLPEGQSPFFFLMLVPAARQLTVGNMGSRFAGHAAAYPMQQPLFFKRHQISSQRTLGRPEQIEQFLLRCSFFSF